MSFALLVVLSRLDAEYSIQNVFAIYREAGSRWLAGEDLYPAHLLFNYFPPSAVLLAPFSWLPFPLGGAIWRFLNLAVFALGLWRLSQGSQRLLPTTRFFIATLITVALSGSAARYGQMTLAMAGFMMAAVAYAECGALWRAAVCAAVAMALKPLALVLVLLLVVVYPRISWRAAIATALLFVVPFAFQDADYVWRQYAAVPDMLATRGRPQYGWQQNVFGLLDRLGWASTNVQATIIRAASALGVLFLCWRARHRVPVIGTALAIYALAVCYILLFGSGTERNTYAMLTPAIGLLAAAAWNARDRGLLWVVSSAFLITLFSRVLQRIFPDTVLAMAKPIACLILLVWLVRMALCAPRREPPMLAAQRASIWREHPVAKFFRAIARQFLAFATVGAISTAVHYVTLIAGVSLGFDPVPASAVGWTLGAVASYSLNYRLTFHCRLAHRHAAPRFALVAGIGLVLNTLFMGVQIKVLGIPYLIAQFIATGTILCWNFAMSRVWAFKGSSDGVAPREHPAQSQAMPNGAHPYDPEHVLTPRI